MVTLTSADNALKKVYLGVISNQLNVGANPLFAKIKQTTADVWGKEIVKMAPFGINGGIGAGAEDGELPSAAGNRYVQFVSDLKNLYGKIELSDKAIRASENNVGAFVNLLNDEMEGLIKASAFNFGRMLFGDGSGTLATITQAEDDVLTVSSVKNLIEGVVVDFYTSAGVLITALKGARIVYVDRVESTIRIDKVFDDEDFSGGEYITVQNSKDKELTGLGKIFESTGTLYGVDRTTNPWMIPYMKDSVGEITDEVIQTAIDTLEENTGSEVDFIVCSSTVKRLYQSYLSKYKRNIDIMELQGGYKAISYNGIPVVSDRFVSSDTMYLLNTKEFALHQLCDWKWLEGEDGRILKQNSGFATYSATLVKYADLICNKPSGQAKLSGISAPEPEEPEV